MVILARSLLMSAYSIELALHKKPKLTAVIILCHRFLVFPVEEWLYKITLLKLM